MTHLSATRLREADTQKIVYALSHDFQAPVRHIRSFLDILISHLDGKLDEEAAGYVNRITSAVETLQDRLEALTRYSRVTTHGAEPGSCDAASVVDEALALLRQPLDRARAKVDVEPLPWVVADRQQLVTVFVELIGNALKFSSDPPQVRIFTVADGDRHLVSVEDQGPGFREQDLDTAFDLFRRFHPASVPGTGTGLAIVQRILDRLGEQVEICPSSGSGTTVRFSLRASGVPTSGGT